LILLIARELLAGLGLGFGAAGHILPYATVYFLHIGKLAFFIALDPKSFLAGP